MQYYDKTNQRLITMGDDALPIEGPVSSFSLSEVTQGCLLIRRSLSFPPGPLPSTQPPAPSCALPPTSWQTSYIVLVLPSWRSCMRQARVTFTNVVNLLPHDTRAF